VLGKETIQPYQTAFEAKICNLARAGSNARKTTLESTLASAQGTAKVLQKTFSISYIKMREQIDNLE
jgi:hypothetical protein